MLQNDRHTPIKRLATPFFTENIKKSYILNRFYKTLPKSAINF